jgi:transposase
MSMTGIDYFSATMLSSEIDDINRFSSPQKLVSWA